MMRSFVQTVAPIFNKRKSYTIQQTALFAAMRAHRKAGFVQSVERA